MEGGDISSVFVVTRLTSVSEEVRMNLGALSVCAQVTRQKKVAGPVDEDMEGRLLWCTRGLCVQFFIMYIFNAGRWYDYGNPNDNDNYCPIADQVYPLLCTTVNFP